MKCTEINPVGNFGAWEPSKVEELLKKEIGESLGQELLFENRNIRVWEVVLFPNERLPFRKINRNYSFVSMTDGSAITRCGTGRIKLVRFKKGDSVFMEFEGSQVIRDLENIGKNLLFFHIMEFKPLVQKTNGLNVTSWL